LCIADAVPTTSIPPMINRRRRRRLTMRLMARRLIISRTSAMAPPGDVQPIMPRRLVATVPIGAGVGGAAVLCQSNTCTMSQEFDAWTHTTSTSD
jgi:hypothetical protein